jgi:Asp-tRNA(Asn)/Glu-tRNA(Gln) amidotransferase A subunit family amidase
VAALKPSIGFVSRTALIPISRSQDTAGPWAAPSRTARS